MKSHEPTVTDVALGVKQVSVGVPLKSHVYLIDARTGPIAFDAASETPARRSSRPPGSMRGNKGAPRNVL
jgi:hypothetical protein